MVAAEAARFNVTICRGQDPEVYFVNLLVVRFLVVLEQITFQLDKTLTFQSRVTSYSAEHCMLSWSDIFPNISEYVVHFCIIFSLSEGYIKFNVVLKKIRVCNKLVKC